MKCSTCGEQMTLQRTEPIHDKVAKKVVGKMLYYVCKNQHISQVPQKK